MSSTKKNGELLRIETKEDALLLLDELMEICQETIFFLSNSEKQFYILTLNQLNAMKNSIDHSQDFFKDYFENKTHEEIKKWIENESKKW